MAIEAGDILQGKVAEVRDFGAFVWLDDGKKGLVHISEISDDYVKDIHNLVKPNQKVKIKVTKTVNGGPLGPNDTFTFTLRQGATTANASDT